MCVKFSDRVYLGYFNQEQNWIKFGPDSGFELARISRIMVYHMIPKRVQRTFFCFLRLYLLMVLTLLIHKVMKVRALKRKNITFKETLTRSAKRLRKPEFVGRARFRNRPCSISPSRCHTFGSCQWILQLFFDSRMSISLNLSNGLWKDCHDKALLNSFSRLLHQICMFQSWQDIFENLKTALNVSEVTLIS